MCQLASLERLRLDFLSFGLCPLQWQLTGTRPLLFAITPVSPPYAFAMAPGTCPLSVTMVAKFSIYQSL